MNPYSFRTGPNIRYGGYLIVDKGGAMRLSRRPPPLSAGEVAIGLQVDVPRAVFERPQLKAEVTVPAGAGLTPDQAIQAVVGIIQQGTSYEVEVSAK